jgi:hypothetical protein
MFSDESQSENNHQITVPGQVVLALERSLLRIVAATLLPGEGVGDLEREGIDAGDVHVGGGGNRDAEIRERQE